MLDSEDLRQRRDHLPRLVAEKMLDHSRNFFWLDNIFQSQVT
jgi:hypothetical protein